MISGVKKKGFKQHSGKRLQSSVWKALRSMERDRSTIPIQMTWMEQRRQVLLLQQLMTLPGWCNTRPPTKVSWWTGVPTHLHRSTQSL